MTLFEVLKTALHERGWTIPVFARRSGVSTQLAYKWLSEDPRMRINPSPDSCQKIAAALGLDPDYVLELAGHRQSRSPEAEADPLNVYLAETMAEMREVLRDVPRPLWSTVIRAFRRGVDNGRDIAAALHDGASQDGPVSSPPSHTVRSAKPEGPKRPDGNSDTDLVRS